MSLDNADVSALARADERAVVYQATGLAEGDHSLEVRIADGAGNEKPLKSVFSVRLPVANKIVAVRHDAVHALTADETLEVTMDVREPGKSAYFAIGDQGPKGTMLRVTNTNTYRGRYQVKRGDQIFGAGITAHFVDNQNNEYTMAATTPVDIAATLPNTLTITSPETRRR